VLAVQQRNPVSVALFLLLALIIAGAVALVPAPHLYVYWLAVGGAALLALYVVKGSLLTAVLVWIFTLICLHEEFWRMPVPFFFAVTVPRLLIVVLVLLFVLMLALGRLRLNIGWPISGAMVALAVYFTASAIISGFETRSPVTVHYRLIGGYLFPFTVFVLLLHAVRHERHLRQIAVFFFVISAYLTFTGWMEYFRFWPLVWPRFIADPSVGIHWTRVRGPFVMSAAMGLALVYCYFNNLVLARQLRGAGRWIIYALNLLVLPVLFWTKTRSVWVAFLLCCAVWFAYSRRRTSRAVWVSFLITLSVLVGIFNLENFLSDRREVGGFTDLEPVYLRLGLALISKNMFLDRPLFGVGFGHFRDFAPQYAHDPSSPYYAFATTALEHNNLLSILAETGLVGVVLYLALIVMILRLSVRLFRKIPQTAPGFINRDLIVLYWILVLAYLIDGTLRETSDNPFANSLFFGLSAVVVALDTLLGRAPLERFAVPAGRPPAPTLPVPTAPHGPPPRTSRPVPPTRSGSSTPRPPSPRPVRAADRVRDMSASRPSPPSGKGGRQ